ncbi:MAG: MBL fold metallo-hydrolase [Bacillota bacterium]|nr:MBL fold metallo-hydrolase [Bacillota bacterium]
MSMHPRPVETGKLAENLYAVKTATVNLFLYKEGNNTICIDSGFNNRVTVRQLKKLEINPENVTHLFLTHSDFDHVNGLVIFKNAEIYISSEEEQMITRKKARMFGIFFNKAIKRKINLLRDNDEISAGSIKVRALLTPGHTPGSMSYLLNDSILFGGDTFKVVNNKIYPLKRFYNMDTELQKESIRRLARLENIKLACTAHTGCTQSFDEAVREWK